ncbi:piwi 1 [Brachionus plicatilis]|uniref:Piwi 1 n=1 Tax=Brachionus plicatilis TaxID=10195 RepID=A0A3M7QV83_BRAPC|nr:piwi 1 [Brachionus plicatilis]
MSGRSRGRARTSTVPQPTPIPAPGESTTPKVTTPQRAPIPPAEQTGRGRGIAPEQERMQSGQISPVSRSSGESPPQQHSPPRTSTTSGRASIRGAFAQAGASTAIGQLERMTLREGEPEAKREMRIEQVYRTRPQDRVNTVGTGGQPVKLMCNYFKIINSPDWVLYQYHVDFSPQIDSRKLRVGLLRNHDHLFPMNKAFDGSTLYSLTKLHNELTEVASKRESDGAIIAIKIKRIAEIVPESPNFVHLFNLVFRRCLKLYGMKEIDRNYYDLRNKITIERYNLEMINGFATSIALYEHHLLLNAEMIHKLLHKTSVFKVMMDLYERTRSDNEFRELCANELIGRIVMTKYNDKTYRINDIDWDTKPSDKFETLYGTTTFIDYYKKS